MTSWDQYLADQGDELAGAERAGQPAPRGRGALASATRKMTGVRKARRMRLGSRPGMVRSTTAAASGPPVSSASVGSGPVTSRTRSPSRRR
jgi:hypothetical protein